ncbi:MAG: RIP metalloprotease RseP [Thermacetogeniaceae bacterium]
MFIIIALVVLSFLIFVHELGHFVVAKLSRMTVDEFSLGFGPAIISKQWGETRYSLRLLPLGGYNKIAGMEPNDDRPDGFDKKPLTVRIGVILAGSLSNFLIAALLFIFTLSFIGQAVLSNTNVIGEVIRNSPAEQIGLQSGDQIVQIDSVRTVVWDDVASAIHAKGQQQITVTVKRNNQLHDFKVVPRYDQDLKIGQIGISPTIVWERQGFLSAVNIGLKSAIGFARLIIVSLYQLITGQVAMQNISGPVGVVQQIGDSARSGLGTLLMYTGILGINLAIVNLLPFPALDGSRILFLLLEGLRGKPINPEKEGMIHLVGFAILMGLVLLITYNDIMRLFTGG